MVYVHMSHNLHRPTIAPKDCLPHGGKGRRREGGCGEVGGVGDWGGGGGVCIMMFKRSILTWILEMNYSTGCQLTWKQIQSMHLTHQGRRRNGA